MLVPRRGAPTGLAREIACLCTKNENRDLISARPFAQNPNPGLDRAYAKRDSFDVSPRVDDVGGHFATVSLLMSTDIKYLTYLARHGFSDLILPRPFRCLWV
jgi:hypothetical protein